MSQSAVNVEPDAKLLERKIVGWETKLFDLSKKNRMLNFRETKRTILRIIDPLPSVLFQRIVEEEKTLTFVRPIDRESDTRTYSLLSLLSELSCPIEASKGDIKTTGSYIERQKTIRNMRSKAHLALDEQGINILYMVLGFVEWHGGQFGDDWIASPLVLVPVSLRIESQRSPFSLVHYEDDIVTNPTLSYIFDTQFGISLPSFDPDDEIPVDAYFDKVEALLNKKDWRLKREACLALLSFQKINMYKDLRNNRERMLRNSVLRMLSGIKDGVAMIDPALRGFQHDTIAPQDCFQVVDADSSQQDAVLLSQKGVSFVMQGPPGTGKSQTITNIIAQAIAEGKKVLFVSEKMAALQVVYRRLEEAHLSDFCLPLHSSKASKKDVIAILGETLRLKREHTKPDALSHLEELNIERQRLNAYAASLHKELEPLMISVYEAYGRLAAVIDHTPLPVCFGRIEVVSDDTLRKMQHAVREYNSIIVRLGNRISENPWIGIIVPFLSHGQIEKYSEELTFVLNTLGRFIESLQAIDDESRFLEITSAQNLPFIVNIIQRSIGLFGIPEQWAAMSMDELTATGRLLQENLRLQDAYECLLSKLKSRYTDSYFRIVGKDVAEQLSEYDAVLYRLTGQKSRDFDNVDQAISVQEKTVRCVLEKLVFAIDRAQQISSAIGLPSPAGFAEIRRVFQLADNLLEGPYVTQAWLTRDGLDAIKSIAQRTREDTHAILKTKRAILHIDADRCLTSEEEALLYDVETDDGTDRSTIQICGELFSKIRVLEQWLNDERRKHALLLLTQAREYETRLSSIQKAILELYEPEILNIDYKTIACRYKSNYTNIFRLLKPAYHADRKTIRGYRRKFGEKIGDAEIICLLKDLSERTRCLDWFNANKEFLTAAIGDNYCGESTDWNEQIACLETIPLIQQLQMQRRALKMQAAQMKRCFGDCYRGENSDWDEIERSILCVERIYSLLGKTELTTALKSLLLERRLPTCISEPHNEAELCTAMQDITAVLLPQWRAPNDVPRIINALQEIIDTGSQLEKLYDRLKESQMEPYTAAALQDDVENLVSLQAIEARFDSNSSAWRELFGIRFQGLETSWADLAKIQSELMQLRRDVGGLMLPDNFVERVCCSPDCHDRMLVLEESAQRLFETKPLLEQLQSLFSDKWMTTLPFRDVFKRLCLCKDNLGALELAIDYNIRRKHCIALGLQSFIEAIEDMDGAVADIPQAFDRCFYYQWLSYQCEQIEPIAHFLKRAQDRGVEQFRHLDRIQLQIAQARIREKLIAALPDEQRFMIASDELSILQHELTKKSRLMPLRKLFRQIPNLLLALKPCLMMSPLSVAHFLEAETYRFDLVIFDEASQIFPEDAIGAILRGAQVIIAGDSKQLPPTNFFAASTDNRDDEYDTEDDEYVDEVYDSILEEASNRFSIQSRLLWHYRSKSEDLIAFSNHRIYGGDLITFPGNRVSQADTGVEYHYVENGIYEHNINKFEAQRCAKLVFEHIRKYPHRSLGVIAFSEKQQDAIEDVINRARASLPEYEWFFEEDREEPFFIKNLENVQGDERDTIIFSICYARNRSGAMYMRFGPLGHPGGERRLNVAITRAKYNVKLVGSILPEDIDLSRTGAEGPRMLREYIEYARRGSEMFTSQASRKAVETEDLFCDYVAEYLKQQGYRVKQHVGCSSYTVDIGVLCEDNSDKYLAGIECDGDTYVKARTARERDRIRSDVLTSMDWKLYRVWSTDWMRDPETAKAALLTYLCDLKRMTREKGPEKDVPLPLDSVTDFRNIIENKDAPKEPEAHTQMPVPLSIAPYIVANWWDAPKHDKYSLGNAERIVDAILYVVSVEQPIHKELLYRRMAGMFGNQHATNVIRNSVDYYLSRACMSQLRCDEDFWMLKDLESVRPRLHGGRTIDQIAKSETSAVMSLIIKNSYGIMTDELFSAATRMLGFERQGPRIVKSMQNALEYMQKRKQIYFMDGKVHLAEAKHGE